MDVAPGSTRSNGNGTQVGAGGKLGDGKRGDAKGRKDAGQEAVPNAAELIKSMPKLKKLLGEKEAASGAYSKAVKAAAKNCGFNADVVRAAVKAHAGEKEDLELATRRAEQLSLAFEALAAH